ncbi:MAG: hypothetical protein HKL81_03005 [Acidimicrobiaceae bacterium]|nr:hypothetical protein [Acidimicrobiaceae bacterium]
MRLHFVAKEGSSWPIQITRWIYNSPIPATVISYPHPAMLPELAGDDFIVVDASLLRSLEGVIEDRKHSSSDSISGSRVIVIGNNAPPGFTCLPEPLILKDLLRAIERGHKSVADPVDQLANQWPESPGEGPGVTPPPENLDYDWLADGWPKNLDIEYPSSSGQNLDFVAEQLPNAPSPTSDIADTNDHGSDSSTQELKSPAEKVSPISPEPPSTTPSNKTLEESTIGTSTGSKKWRNKFKTPESNRDQANSPSTNTGERRTTGHIISVVGSGGVGTSTIAMALAQGLSQIGGSSLLVDARLRGEQAFLNDARSNAMGISELIRATRISRLEKRDLDPYLEWVSTRCYSLLKSGRTKRDWLGWDQDSISSTLETLTSNFGHLVVDVGCDFEGSSDTGSNDIESRNLLGRLSLARSSLVVLVGTDDTKGIFSLASINREISRSELTTSPSLFVMNRCESSRLKRAMDQQELARLLSASANPKVPSAERDQAEVIYIPSRHIDSIIADVLPLPRWMVDPFHSFFNNHSLFLPETNSAGSYDLGKAADL